ncbi:uncharacterized protein J3D65DRAFT_676857 [Phyllosticta citribraziliensis]|uniref:Uncharacterized protein n=1 Tax=Phyllosticta citribraziliensis TaxID=989973 RepID=A0ABR1LQJ2_9PEZI
MLAQKITSIIAMAVGLLIAPVLAQNGERACYGGAISCEYPKGRCAKLCQGVIGPYGTACDCPDGQEDNPYTGASCITITQALGRQSC